MAGSGPLLTIGTPTFLGVAVRKWAVSGLTALGGAPDDSAARKLGHGWQLRATPDIRLPIAQRLLLTEVVVRAFFDWAIWYVAECHFRLDYTGAEGGWWFRWCLDAAKGLGSQKYTSTSVTREER
jgi:hypothetical protein